MFKCGNTSTQSGSSHSSNRYRLLEGYSLVLVSNICLYSLLPGEMIKEMNKSTKNERMPPENLWLEDVFFLLKMVPFSRGSTCFFLVWNPETFGRHQHGVIWSYCIPTYSGFQTAHLALRRFRHGVFSMCLQKGGRLERFQKVSGMNPPVFEFKPW